MRVVRKCLIPKPYDFELTTVGEHIKKERLKRGLRQKDVARLFGVDMFTILNWETGATRPQIKDVPALINFLGYDPEPSNPISIADHLWAKRRLQGWSQRQAATYIGVDSSTWASWESGTTIMLPNHRELVARFTGLSCRDVNPTMKRQWNTAHGKPTVE